MFNLRCLKRLTWKSSLVVLLFLLLTSFSVALNVPQATDPDEAGRAKLLSYILRHQLIMAHFSHKQMDDELSTAAYDLYLKQLDFQKRFLLKQDVERLESFRTSIDDEMNLGKITLPAVASSILRERVGQVMEMVESILAQDLDYDKSENLETDPKKLDFCSSLDELRQRWRKNLKYQVIARYLNLREDQLNATEDKDKAVPSEEDLFREAREKVLKSQTDFLERMQQETLRDHFDRYFNTVARAFDPHTHYMPPTEKEDFDISMRGSLEGIGALLREEDGYIKVVSIIPGSAAAKQGQLQAEDVILKVGEGAGEPVDVTDTRIRDAVALIRGKKGTEVRLTVKKSDGSQMIIPIMRDVVQIEESFVKSTVLSGKKKGVSYGYIKVPSFYRDFAATQNGKKGRNSTDDVLAELESLKKEGIDGLILDLRNNGGGSLMDAVSITGLFIETGPVVLIKSSDGRMETLEDRDPFIGYKGPVIVLVNRFSASASEIVAGALQDYGRAIVVGGEHTHGKGTVQAMIDLNQRVPFLNMGKYLPLGALKVTTQKFYRVTGESTQYRGIVPDIVLPDNLEHLETGEQYLDHSLPWDTVQEIPFRPWNKPVEDLDVLRRESDGRVNQDKDFASIVEQNQAALARREKTLQAIDLETVRKEWQESKARLEADGGAPHGPMDKKEDKKAEELSKDEKQKRWIEELEEDPYTREAMDILMDMRKAAP